MTAANGFRGAALVDVGVVVVMVLVVALKSRWIVRREKRWSLQH